MILKNHVTLKTGEMTKISFAITEINYNAKKYFKLQYYFTIILYLQTQIV